MNLDDLSLDDLFKEYDSLFNEIFDDFFCEVIAILEKVKEINTQYESNT